MLILASQQQEHEVGDGTNFVIILAGKLLEKAEHLLRMVERREGGFGFAASLSNVPYSPTRAWPLPM